MGPRDNRPRPGTSQAKADTGLQSCAVRRAPFCHNSVTDAVQVGGLATVCPHTRAVGKAVPGQGLRRAGEKGSFQMKACANRRFALPCAVCLLVHL